MILVLLTGSLLALAGEISDYHFKYARDKSGDSSKSRSRAEVASTNHGITEICIERSGCFGTCPIYTFIAKSNGTFRYSGDKHVERKGEFTGTVPVWQFHRLAQLIRDTGYMEFEDSYDAGGYDNSTTYTMVVMNGKHKTVRNYAEGGPTKLWAIEQLIDNLMAHAQWEIPPKNPSVKK